MMLSEAEQDQDLRMGEVLEGGRIEENNVRSPVTPIVTTVTPIHLINWSELFSQLMIASEMIIISVNRTVCWLRHTALRRLPNT